MVQINVRLESATQETWVGSLGLEDPLEGSQRGRLSMATCSSILGEKSSRTEELGGYCPKGCKELDTTEVTQRDAGLESAMSVRVSFG